MFGIEGVSRSMLGIMSRNEIGLLDFTAECMVNYPDCRRELRIVLAWAKIKNGDRSRRFCSHQLFPIQLCCVGNRLPQFAETDRPVFTQRGSERSADG